VRVHVLAVHGIGHGARRGFSVPLRQRVIAELERLAPAMAAGLRRRPQGHFWREVVWDAGLPNETLFARLYPGGDPMAAWARTLLRRLGRPTYREFAFYHLGDIFGYYGRRRAVLARLREEVARIIQEHRGLPHGPRSGYLTLVGYSMGSVVAFDFLHEAQRWPGRDGEARAGGARLVVDTHEGPAEGLTAAGLFTLGSPLALFSLLTGEGQHHYRAEGGPPFRLAPGGVWCNFYDEEDVVSFPLRGLFGALVEDVAVDNCRLPLAGVLFSHGGYWRSAAVARRLARHILALEGPSAAPTLM
jgi:hypothetical protein